MRKILASIGLKVFAFYQKMRKTQEKCAFFFRRGSIPMSHRKTLRRPVEYERAPVCGSSPSVWFGTPRRAFYYSRLRLSQSIPTPQRQRGKNTPARKSPIVRNCAKAQLTFGFPHSTCADRKQLGGLVVNLTESLRIFACQIIQFFGSLATIDETRFTEGTRTSSFQRQGRPDSIHATPHWRK